MVFAQEAKYIQVQTTMESSLDAEKISTLLVEKRLAACAQTLGPITSLYWWDGNVERAQEFLLLIKTRAELFEEVERVIKDNHPYDLPEIIAVPIRKGNDKYLKWIQDESESGKK